MKNKRMYGNYEPKDFENGTRRCVFCGNVKFMDEFAKNGVDADGNAVHRQDCKTCYNIRRKENRLKKVHSDFVGGQKRRTGENVTYTHQEWKDCLIYFGGECAYCGRTPRKRERLTKDHLVAVSEGGLTIADNIVPACHSCNSSKQADDFRDWFMRQSFFSQERLNKVFKWRSIMRQAGGENTDGDS